jgi:hypothetical protein
MNGNGTYYMASAGGAGGPGRISNISGTPVAYAGGGGGGAWQNSSQIAPGGIGGGGNAGYYGVTTIYNGTTNTGGGGGGAYTVAYSGTGGSGIVIIRYPSTYNLPASVTGTYTTTVVAGYRIYSWTGSGSITF